MIKFGKNHKKKKNLQGKQSKILSIQQNLPFFVKGVDDLNYKVDLCPYCSNHHVCIRRIV